MKTAIYQMIMMVAITFRSCRIKMFLIYDKRDFQSLRSTSEQIFIASDIDFVIKTPPHRISSALLISRHQLNVMVKPTSSIDARITFIVFRKVISRLLLSSLATVENL